jgi:hypothetical protein
MSEVNREARIELEQIVRESPKHLNALADLEIIYRNLYRMKDANRCFDAEVLYLDIHVFHHHFCHTQLSVFCVYLISSIPTYSH